jgi:hypothetical protein
MTLVSQHLVSRQLLDMVPGDGTKVWDYTYEQGGSRGRVGKERGGKEMDGCPFTGGSRLSLRLSSSRSLFRSTTELDSGGPGGLRLSLR